MSQDLGLADQVTFLGRISDDGLLALYNACDIFVLTPEEQRWDRWLDSEGFGLVFHEAGACAKPVVGTNVSGCSEAVRHNISGILIPPSDPIALARTVTRTCLHHRSRKDSEREACAWCRNSADGPVSAPTPLSLSPDFPLTSHEAEEGLLPRFKWLWGLDSVGFLLIKIFTVTLPSNGPAGCLRLITRSFQRPPASVPLRPFAASRFELLAASPKVLQRRLRSVRFRPDLFSSAEPSRTHH
jgi:Glycosyl transferases group 1